MQHKIFGWPRKSTNEKFQQEKTNNLIQLESIGRRYAMSNYNSDNSDNSE